MVSIVLVLWILQQANRSARDATQEGKREKEQNMGWKYRIVELLISPNSHLKCSREYRYNENASQYSR